MFTCTHGSHSLTRVLVLCCLFSADIAKCVLTHVKLPAPSASLTISTQLSGSPRVCPGPDTPPAQEPALVLSSPQDSLAASVVLTPVQQPADSGVRGEDSQPLAMDHDRCHEQQGITVFNSAPSQASNKRARPSDTVEDTRVSGSSEAASEGQRTSKRIRLIIKGKVLARAP